MTGTTDKSATDGVAMQSLAPTGRLGFGGRTATPEGRAQVMGEFFFEGPRRVPYLEQASLGGGPKLEEHERAAPGMRPGFLSSSIVAIEP